MNQYMKKFIWVLNQTGLSLKLVFIFDEPYHKLNQLLKLQKLNLSYFIKRFAKIFQIIFL